MKKLRFLLILLCFCLMLPIAACGKEEPTNDIPDDKYFYDDSSREKASDTIPYGYTLDNQSIGIWYFGVGTEVIGIDDTTDIVYSRIHERNLSVEDRLKVDLDFQQCNDAHWTDGSATLRQEIQTMSAAFEAAFAANNQVIQMKLFNYFHNLNDSEYIDTSEPWWYEDAIMELSVDNYNYRFLYGDFTITNIGKAGCVYYNKAIYEQYVSANKDPDELYDKVLDGTWTLDEFHRLIKKSHIEKGGDGSTDIYGLAMTYAEWTHYLRESAGIRLYARDPNGMINISFNDERSIDFTNKLYALFFENEGTVNSLYGGVENKASFVNSTLLFDMNQLLGALSEEMREMKDDFGILPYPKLDEFQDTYYTLIHNSSTSACIPISTDEDRANEEISAVIEAIGSESYRSVSVAFYETALKAAYNRDDQSAQMIDIITGQHNTVKSSLTKNFVYEYATSLSAIGSIFHSLMVSGNTNFMSSYDATIGPAEQGLKDLIKLYKDGKI